MSLYGQLFDTDLDHLSLWRDAYTPTATYLGTSWQDYNSSAGEDAYADGHGQELSRIS